MPAALFKFKHVHAVRPRPLRSRRSWSILALQVKATPPIPFRPELHTLFSTLFSRSKQAHCKERQRSRCDRLFFGTRLLISSSIQPMAQLMVQPSSNLGYAVGRSRDEYDFRIRDCSCGYTRDSGIFTARIMTYLGPARAWRKTAQ